MSECVERLKQMNPEFDHYLYDDADCRRYIKENFHAQVVWAYDKLIPGAYKADLWRYCVLYKMGGIYVDIKFQCEPGFSLMEMTKDPDTFVLDRTHEDNKMSVEKNICLVNSPDFYNSLFSTKHEWWTNNNNQIGLYNAVMASVPNNPIFYNCIQAIVKNVQTKYYGESPLSPTGPDLLGKLYYKNEYKTKIKELKYFNSCIGTYIINKQQKVLSQYPEYRDEQKKYKKTEHYHYLWMNKKIYK
jgi:mannosyltransferase OCH1-like enzyme